jgi:hypothetical protein
MNRWLCRLHRIAVIAGLCDQRLAVINMRQPSEVEHSFYVGCTPTSVSCLDDSHVAVQSRDECLAKVLNFETKDQVDLMMANRDQIIQLSNDSGIHATSLECWRHDHLLATCALRDLGLSSANCVRNISKETALVESAEGVALIEVHQKLTQQQQPPPHHQRHFLHPLRQLH